MTRLLELAHNLWWSWNPQARRLFEVIDPTLWRLTQHNPVKLLQDVKPERLEVLREDPVFIEQCAAVLSVYDDYMQSSSRWHASMFPHLSRQLIAYFSAEFGLHQSIPIYSGGLGILAGDHCKEASDLGVPLVGIGFMYPQGYFRQRLSPEGWQEAEYEPFNRLESPIQPALTLSGFPCRITVPVSGRDVAANVWQVQIGTVRLYLLDTDVTENTPGDREWSARLYGGDQETRLGQEMILGIGGVRALRELGLSPAVWHANEGYSAFLCLERARELVQAGMSWAEAADVVRQSNVFTTHTPVPAGHDVFPPHLVEQYFEGYWQQLGLTKETFLSLGAHPDPAQVGLNMTILAMRLSQHVNGVSQAHGRVSRGMWQSLWPESLPHQIPIHTVTNGIHAPTWIAPEMGQLYFNYVSPEWPDRIDDPAIWHRVTEIPDRELWAVRQLLKEKMVNEIRERARAGWMQGRSHAPQVLTSGVLFNPDALTIGFARRFATYKRALLIFKSLARLRHLLLDYWRPVQLVFAGKAHPADEPGRQFIHEVYRYCQDHELGGHVAFIEDYDMHTAKFLVQGVDVWLNTPRPPMEACGTSGQKAALNGVPHLGVLDGWWEEGYDGANGWAITSSPKLHDPEAQDADDAEQLYRILENEVVPLYYLRDRDGIPRGWLHLVRDAIRTIVPRFCTRRMVKDYVELFYAPASSAKSQSGNNP